MPANANPLDPHVEPIIYHGVRPVGAHQDEESAFVKSCTWTGERDLNSYKGDNFADVYDEYTNPRLTFEMELSPRVNAQGEYYGLGNAHPGQELTDLVNVADGRNIMGFVITQDMSIQAGNPKRSSGTDGVSVTLPGVVKPFVKSRAALAAPVPAPGA